MTKLTLIIVLSAVLLAPVAQAQTSEGARRPPTLEVTEPPLPDDAEPAPEPQSADLGEQIRDDAPPRAQDFAGRMVLVGVGAALGEAGLGLLGLYIGAQSNSIGSALLFAVIGGTAGAWLGASMFGALVPDTNAYATGGALLGALAGLAVAVPLSVPLSLLVIVLPALGAAVGYAVGFNLEPRPSETARRHEDGFRISPVVALAPGGGHVGLAGIF